MANLQAIYAVGESLVSYLRQSYSVLQEQLEQTALEGVTGLRLPSCEFRLLSSSEFDTLEEPGTMLSLFLHRVTINEHLRNTAITNLQDRQQVPLSVDLHYLLTAWATSAAVEQVILAWAMRQLHLNPILDRASLTEQADWQTQDLIHVIPAELSHEDLMRIWDALKPSYRLSVAYIARTVRIESDQYEDTRPVVAMRLGWRDREVQP